MIVGIVIGSGIFFKTDDILGYTNGSVWLGVLVFSIAALSIIFGSLSISNLAALTDRPGGAMTYAEEFISKRFGSAFGWFQVFVYFPTLSVVLSWVVGIYFCQLFNIDAGLMGQIGVGIAWFLVCFGFNILSAKIGGAFQNASTIIKLIPLIVIAAAGLIFGNPAAALTAPQAAGGSAGWVAAIGPIAFSFDGWIISTAIAHEVKNAKSNVPKALVFAPLFILLGYLLYFVGVSAYLGPQTIISLGNESVAQMSLQLFGPFASKALITFVTISVMGTANGVILGYIRLPYSLSLRGMLPGSKWLSKINPKNSMPVNSGIFAMCVCAVWWVIHYFTMQYGIIGNSDISEIAIVMCYVLFAVLYFRVFLFWLKGKIKGVFKGLIFPLLATMGAGFIVYGGLQNPYFFIFVGICFLVLLCGFFMAPKEIKEI